MTAIIELNSEFIVDGSRVRNPYLRLLLAAVGQKLAIDSPWVAIDKKVVDERRLLCPLTNLERQLIGI
jgi:hypothetical protein